MEVYSESMAKVIAAQDAWAWGRRMGIVLLNEPPSRLSYEDWDALWDLYHRREVQHESLL